MVKLKFRRIHGGKYWRNAKMNNSFRTKILHMNRLIAISYPLQLFLKDNPDYLKNKEVMNELEQAIGNNADVFKKAYPLGIQAMKEIMQSIDIFLSMELSNDDTGISCKKGCSYCCHQNVDIYPLEAKLIVDHCRNNKIDIDIGYLKEQAKIPGIELVFSKDYATCVFLKDNVCSIYESRPIACRKYYVGTPAELCDTKKYPPPQNKVGVVFFPEVEILVSAVETARLEESAPMAHQLLNVLLE